MRRGESVTAKDKWGYEEETDVQRGGEEKREKKMRRVRLRGDTANHHTS